MNRLLQISLVLVSALALSPTGHAQSLTDRIAAVDLAQARQIAEQHAAQARQVAEQQAAQARQVAGQQAAIEAQRREARQVEERRHAEILAAHQAQLEVETQIATTARVQAEQSAEATRVKVAEDAADKRRDQNHEDKLRDLDIETKKIQLEALKTRVSRENDYVDKDLQRQGAETDVTQSTADSNRNLSSGLKSLLERTGEAEVRAASRTTSTTVLELSGGKGIQQLSH